MRDQDRAAVVGDIVIRNTNSHRLRVVDVRAIGLAILYDVVDLDDEKGRDDERFLIDRSKVRGPLMSEEEKQDRKSAAAGKDD